MADDRVLEARPILERFRLDGRVALVTGAGQGIGRGFAHALGEAGAAVAVVDIVTEQAEEVANELANKGIDALPITADVTQADQVQQMVDITVDYWGKLTVGVNNAGISIWANAETIYEEDWRGVLDVNLNGVFLCAQAEGRVMLEAAYGKIINIASMSGHIVNAPQNQSAYNTSKAGVIHLTCSLAAEWAPRGVCVNSISPGYTRTKLVDNMLETPEGQDVMSTWMDMTPLSRMADVTDLQGAVIYLASEASDFMTGHDMIIDGGYCIW